MNDYDGMIPTSLKECYKTDEVTAALIGWSKNILTWGAILTGVTVVVGLITAIMAASSTYDEEATAFFVTFLPYVLGAFAEMLVFKFISFVVYVVASFHENSAISTNVTLYRAAKEERHS